MIVASSQGTLVLSGALSPVMSIEYLPRVSVKKPGVLSPFITDPTQEYAAA